MENSFRNNLINSLSIPVSKNVAFRIGANLPVFGATRSQKVAGKTSSGRKSSTVIYDDEFGDIPVRRMRTRYVRLKVLPNGQISATIPMYAPLTSVRSLLDHSRTSLRKSRDKAPKKREYADGDIIGKSHKLIIQPGNTNGSRLAGQKLLVTLTPNVTALKREEILRDAIKKALRKEAKSYLPRRLQYLADQYQLTYETVRFSHAKSRWGSCSSNGTISLNIALMMLPNELIDYVVLHELAHTKHMNHSPEFWAELERMCPGAKAKRKEIKNYSPFL